MTIKNFMDIIIDIYYIQKAFGLLGDLLIHDNEL